MANLTTMLLKAAKPVLVQGFKILGKEISKKAIYITGGVAGTTALAGVTTAVVVHHKHKKNDELNEAISAVEDKVEELKQDNNIEVKKDIIEDKLQEKAEEIVADETIKTEKTEKVEDQKATEAPAAPVSDNNVIYPFNQQSMPQQTIINPAPAGPNPAFQMMQPQMNPYELPNLFGPVNQQQHFVPEQQIIIPDQMITDPADQAPVEEAGAEKVDHNDVEENPPTADTTDVVDSSTPVEDKDVVLTGLDIATGKKPAKNKKESKNKRNKTAVEIPSSKKR